MLSVITLHSELPSACLLSQLLVAPWRKKWNEIIIIKEKYIMMYVVSDLPLSCQRVLERSRGLLETVTLGRISTRLPSKCKCQLEEWAVEGVCLGERGVWWGAVRTSQGRKWGGWSCWRNKLVWCTRRISAPKTLDFPSIKLSCFFPSLSNWCKRGPQTLRPVRSGRNISM